MECNKKALIDIPGNGLLAILGAAPFETDRLIDRLRDVRSLQMVDGTFHFGLYGDWTVLVGSTGLGKVNAAITTSALLERFPVRMVWNAGCAGAFQEGPIAVGDVLVSLSAICGDEGVLAHGRILPTAHIGIPILVRGEEKYYDQIPLDLQSVMQRITGVTPEGCYRLAGPGHAAVQTCREREEKPRWASLAGGADGTATEKEKPVPPPDCTTPEGDSSAFFRLDYGPSLTVGMVSGDMEVARNRFLRYGAYAENMEGSAVAQACFRFRVPMVECRGISNTAGNRNKADWRLADAISHCHGIILNWLDNLTPLCG